MDGTDDLLGTPMTTVSDSPLRPVVTQWLRVIGLAADYKKAVFGDQADEAFKFYNGPHDFMYEGNYARKSKAFMGGGEDTEMAAPAFRVTVNKTAEFVELFGPILYHKNPIRRVRPRDLPPPPPAVFGVDPRQPPPPPPMPGMPPDPAAMAYQQGLFAFQQAQAQAGQAKEVNGYRAALLEFYLNYTPVELGLKDEVRRTIDDALIKGRGCIWTEIYSPPGGTFKLVGSFFDSVDNLFIDADAEDLGKAQWVARRCRHPVWQVEQMYQLPPGSLKGNRESLGQQGGTESQGADGLHRRKKGDTCDHLVYYKIWSRMGLGGRIKGTPEGLKPFLEQFGDHTFLVVAEGVPYPLNLPPPVLEAPAGDPAARQAILTRVAWPIPFWVDAPNPWPFVALDFHPVPRCAWPMGHLTPAMGYQKFINWVASAIANKVRVTSRDIILVDKGAGEDAKTAVERGEDLTVLEVQTTSQKPNLRDFVDFVQHPPMNADILKVLEVVERWFEQATGMSDVLYGQPAKQMRSAQEAALRGDMTRLRPDDMGNRVEDMAALIARKEAMAARWSLEPQDVAPVLGPDGARQWAQLVTSTDVPHVVRELEYRIEAGSARKPNKDLDLANANEAAQFLFPVLMQHYQATGDPTQVNAFLRDWCKARDLDFAAYELPPLPPPPPPGSASPGGHGGPGGGPPPPGPPPGPGMSSPPADSTFGGAGNQGGAS